MVLDSSWQFGRNVICFAAQVGFAPQSFVNIDVNHRVQPRSATSPSAKSSGGSSQTPRWSCWRLPRSISFGDRRIWRFASEWSRAATPAGGNAPFGFRRSSSIRFCGGRPAVKPTWEHWRTAAITGFLLLFVGNGGVCVAEQTVPSGVDSSAGGHRVPVDGDGRLVATRWHAAGGAGVYWTGFGICGSGFAGGTQKFGRIRSSQPGRRDDLGGRFVCVVLRILYSKHGALPLRR